MKLKKLLPMLADKVNEITVVWPCADHVEQFSLHMPTGENALVAFACKADILKDLENFHIRKLDPDNPYTGGVFVDGTGFSVALASENVEDIVCAMQNVADEYRTLGVSLTSETFDE